MSPATTPRSSGSRCSKAIRARLVRMIDGLKGEGAAPPLVLWAMATEIRTLALLKSGQDSGQALAALFKKERVFDRNRQKLAERALVRLSANGARGADARGEGGPDHQGRREGRDLGRVLAARAAPGPPLSKKMAARRPPNFFLLP